MQNYFLLNNIRSIENVGSIYRVADSLGWSLIIQGTSPHLRVKNDKRLPYNIINVEKKLFKTAVQTINYVNWRYFATNLGAYNFIKKQNLSLFCLEESIAGSTNIFKAPKVSKPFVLVLGNEVTGIEDYYLNRADKTFYIPMYGKNNSMNVAVAAAVCGFTLSNK